MPKHLKKLTEETIHQNPWWSYKHDTYQKPNGEVGDYYYGETSGMVMIVPILDDGRLVLTLQHRYLADKQSIEFPGGGMQKDVDVLASARLELFEETGCVAEEFTKIGVIEALNGMVKDTAHVFLAEVERQEAQHLDETEDIEVLFRRPDEVEQMIIRNEIWDGQTLATWSLVRHYFLDKDSSS